MITQKSYSTQAVVLKYISLWESDRLLTLYTPDSGKLRVVAKGVRRTKSKFAGHLEPLTHVNLTVNEGASLGTITDAQSIQSFRTLKSDLQAISIGIYLAELLDSFSSDNLSNPELFELFLNTLKYLDKTQYSVLLTRYFEAQLLVFSGFGPELYVCVECGDLLKPIDHYYSLADGGILCPSCKLNSQNMTHMISMNAIKVIRYLQREKYDNVSKLTLSVSILKETEIFLSGYIRYILEKDLKSAEFMDITISDSMCINHSTGV